MHQRTTRALALGGLAALTLSLTACGPAIGGDGDEPADSTKLQAPTEVSPKGEITIWDREGDLFKVFDEAIAAFNEKYPDIVVHHEAVDIGAKLQNTLITGSDVPDGVFLDDQLVAGYADHLWDLSDVLAPYVDDIAQHHASAAQDTPETIRLHLCGEPLIAPHIDCAHLAGHAHARIDRWDKALPWLLERLHEEDR